MPDPATPVLSGEPAVAGAVAPTKPAAPAKPATAVAPTPAEPTAPDWRAVLETVPDDELAAHPKLQGRIGTIAQKQAERLAQQRAQEILTRERAVAETVRAKAEEERLLREDPQKALDNRLAQIDREKVLAEHEETIFAPVRAFFLDLEPEVKDALTAKDYRGHGNASEQQVAFLKDAFDATLKVAVEKAVGKRAAAIKDAARKELLAELNLAEPSADQGGASAPTPGNFTRTQISAMSPREYSKHRDEILASLQRAG